MSTTGVEDGSSKQDPAIKTHRDLLSLKKFESSFNASLDEAMANFSGDMLDSPVNKYQTAASCAQNSLEIFPAGDQSNLQR